ncbi:MAG TPA: hypothetical protein VMT99_00170 [Candidatus Paceibacterota bacterium]|nr:hypothetical protein [Candidatus Paceibacterota bacterium]
MGAERELICQLPHVLDAHRTDPVTVQRSRRHRRRRGRRPVCRRCRKRPRREVRPERPILSLHVVRFGRGGPRPAEQSEGDLPRSRGQRVGRRLWEQAYRPLHDGRELRRKRRGFLGQPLGRRGRFGLRLFHLVHLFRRFLLVEQLCDHLEPVGDRAVAAGVAGGPLGAFDKIPGPATLLLGAQGRQRPTFYK